MSFWDDRLTLYDLETGETRTLLENRPFEAAHWGRDDTTIYVTDPDFFGADRGVHKLDIRTGTERLIMKMGNRRLTWGNWSMWLSVTPSGEPMFLRDLSIHHIYELDWLKSTDQ